MKKKESNIVLVVLLTVSIGLAAFFGYKTYSVDHRFDIPVVDNIMGNPAASPAVQQKSSTSSGSRNRNQGFGGGQGGGPGGGGPRPGGD